MFCVDGGLDDDGRDDDGDNRVKLIFSDEGTEGVLCCKPFGIFRKLGNEYGSSGCW